MKKTVESYFNVVGKYCETLNSSGLNINFYYEKKDAYIESVIDRYKAYKKDYLQEDVEYLDRHKMAAILVVCGIEHQIVDSGETGREIDKGKIDICCQKILLMAAFDYLLEIMNLKIENADTNLNKINKISFPKAFTCQTKFIDILSRTLFYAEKKYVLNEMELAEKFFLLEYISILKDYPSESEKYFAIFSE